MKVALFGKIEFDSYAGELTVLHPEFEILSGDDEEGDATLHVARVVPIYEAVGKLTTRVLRTFTHRLLESMDPLEDRLPLYLRQRLKLPDRWTALRETHFPPPDSDLRLLNAFRTPAHFRLIFEEFFWLECGIALKRARPARCPASLSRSTTACARRSAPCCPSNPPERRSASSRRSPTTCRRRGP